jgi:general secretion pathway protein F
VQFAARVFDPQQGAAADRLIEAPDAAGARALVESEGLVVLGLEAKGLPVSWAPAWRHTGGFDVRLFCQELKTLLSAGMSLVEALDTLVMKAGDRSNHAVVHALQARLHEGQTFSSALESAEQPFPPILTAAVRASERTGRVADALAEYVRYDGVVRELKRKVWNAAVYPAMVVGFGLLVVLFLLAYVVPRFAQVYEDFAGELSWPTKLLLGLGHLFGQYGAAMGVLALAAVAAAVALHRRGVLGRLALRSLMTLPMARRVMRVFQLARIYRTLCMLLRGGYTVVDALDLSKGLAFDPGLAGAVDRARRSVAEGMALSAAFAQQALTDTVSDRLIKVGERSGRFDVVLETIADAYTQQIETFVERLARVVEPLLLMAVALMVGAIIVLMYMPVFELAGGIGL